MVGADFNVILSDEEKIGGLSVYPHEYEDFSCCINSCDLTDIKYTGSPFTWWNGRVDEGCIFKRLDRVAVNQLLLDIYVAKPFKFLKFWTDSDEFKEVVFQNWLSEEREVWRYFQAIDYPRRDCKAEELFQQAPSPLNRAVLHKVHAELKLYLHYEEEFWRQKASAQWFDEGDRNTRFFHSLVNGRRKKLNINRIRNADGSWAETDGEIANEGVFFFKEQFSKGNTSEDLACGPHGFTGCFYQTCWDIVGPDIIKVVHAFYQGSTLPKSITHTNLALLPKKDVVQSFSDLRPISLSNFLNKIISRLVHDRLEGPLPRLISQNQADFVKGRNITENVLLAQEIVTDRYQETRQTR
ncbi:hypothetical protein H5410_011980 [Solanum commersonii]|uniref:Reverse transcriptase domain-containing protein n=1 Tax=Solanum commersonii TaxID=4109 RepID=A0A9J6ARD6_SOLCO|nr:hypothetical protein H5410_011980 [Solanum commersonii]